MGESGDTTVPATMRAWRVHEYGEPVDVLRLDEVPVPEPGPGEILVHAQAVPLNLNDYERVTGANMAFRPPLPYAPGMETLGVVVAAGAGADALVGRRVAATTKMAIGGFAEYVIGSAAAAFEVPESIALPEAACIFFPFHLAYLGLYDRADLQPGESVLVHAAAGGSGSAAIQLAKHRGAKVFATVGSDAKKQVCLDLGADVVINYTTDDFAEVVLAETGNRGVDVVFDNVGEAVWAKSLKSIAYNGRYVMMGFASDKRYVDEPFIVPRQLSMGNIRLCGVLLSYAPDAAVPSLKSAMGANMAPSSLGARIQREIVELLAAGAIRPVVGRVVGFEELPQALAAMVNRETVGRVVGRLWH
jgi:NADPH2:quinone reductase